MTKKQRFYLFILTLLLHIPFTPHLSFAATQVCLFSPPHDYTSEARYYTLTTTESMCNALLLQVTDSRGVELYRDVPLLIEGGIYATTQIPLTLPIAGEYRFSFGVETSSDTTPKPQTLFFSFSVISNPAPDVLKNIFLSRAPYYVGQSLEVNATFTKTPTNVKIGIREGSSFQRSNILHNSGDLNSVAHLTPDRTGEHEIVVIFIDPKTQTVYEETIPIYVSRPDRGGGTIVTNKDGGGGCSTMSVSTLLIIFCINAFQVKRGLMK